MNAIQLLTIGQTSPQRGQTGAIHPGADIADTADTGMFATLLTRSMTGEAATADAADTKMIPLNPDGTAVDGDVAGEQADRLALTLSATEAAVTDAIEDSAALAEGGELMVGVAAPTTSGQQRQLKATGQTSQGMPTQAASQTAAAAAVAVTAGNAVTGGGVHGGPAATGGNAVDASATAEPSLFDATAETAADDANAAKQQTARKTILEDFETAWQRLASGRQLGVEAATLKVKPGAGDAAHSQRAQPVTASVDGGLNLLALKGEGGDVGAPQMQFSLDGSKGTDRTGLTDAATRSSLASQTAGPADQVAMQIRRAAAGAADRITLQLHPRDLGSVEIRLEFGESAAVRAAVFAERPETLEMLQRDARLLQKALNDAGLEADGNSLSFDLRGEGQQGGQAEGDDRGGAEADADLASADDPDGLADDSAADAVDTYAVAVADGRLDIRI